MHFSKALPSALQLSRSLQASATPSSQASTSSNSELHPAASTAEATSPQNVPQSTPAVPQLCIFLHTDSHSPLPPQPPNEAAASAAKRPNPSQPVFLTRMASMYDRPGRAATLEHELPGCDRAAPRLLCRRRGR